VESGNLAASEIFKALDTGLFLSNLHYLNWSDRPTARITGMTRYACFWVANGEIVAPIENLRFDESLYRCLGEKLVDLTDSQEFLPEVGTYERRSLGGTWTPGLLVDDFTYTL
jgi:predicted Zn-dependent protease